MKTNSKALTRIMPEGLILHRLPMGGFIITFGSADGPIICGPKNSAEEVAQWLRDHDFPICPEQRRKLVVH